MAAFRLNISRNLTKFLQNGVINRMEYRSKSTDSTLTTAVGHLSHVERVVSTEDCTMFVAWHPTSEFPYEHSLPLPPQSIPTSTLLKDDAIQTAMSAFSNKRPEIARLELMKLTNTSKHTWKPRQRDRRAKKTPPDREYL